MPGLAGCWRNTKRRQHSEFPFAIEIQGLGSIGAAKPGLAREYGRCGEAIVDWGRGLHHEPWGMGMGCAMHGSLLPANLPGGQMTGEKASARAEMVRP